MKKLLKHEFIATARVLVFVYCAAALAVVFGRIAYLTEINALIAASTVLMVIGMGASLLLPVVLVVQRFFTSMFGEQGYLTNTLPVSAKKLVLSKLIVAYVWLISGYVVVCGMVLSLLWFIRGKVPDFSAGLQEVLDMVGLTRSVMVQAGIFFAVVTLVQLLFFAVGVMFAITLAHLPLFWKRQGLVAFAAFVVLYIVDQMVESVLVFFFPFGVKITPNGLLLVAEGTGLRFGQQTLDGLIIGLGSVFFELAAIAALFFVISWLVKSKTSVRG